jgi:hypothetical protein
MNTMAPRVTTTATSRSLVQNLMGLLSERLLHSEAQRAPGGSPGFRAVSSIMSLHGG